MRFSRFFSFCILFVLANQTQAQNYNNPGGMVQTCVGNFNDTGGSAATYDDDEYIVTTLCPSGAGNCVSVSFSTFNLENNFDYLTIYDGPSTASPLIGTYTGTSSPGAIVASSGCLTFVFESDFSITNPGWVAQIACVPCGLPPPCAGTTPACASPVPDECSSACHLGTLSAPPACPQTGNATNVFCLNNIGATPASPYNALGGCQPNGANMPNPAADVWYSFVASSNILDVRIQGLNTPSLGFYEGNNCNTFIGRGCGVGSFGLLTASFQPVFPGRRYYLRISGADTSDTGEFTLTITGRNDCDPCLINYNLTASPLPVSTVYQPGERVHFCLTVSQWSPTSVNWLHAVVTDFGPGWNLGSLTVSPPASCDGYGSWGWYNSVTSTATGLVSDPGFFYESTQGCSSCNASNPGDNYGDNCTGAVNFVFCWDITVADCPPAAHGDNLNVSINTYGDGETGSWTSFACAADPLVDFFATLSCCPQPLLQFKNVSCSGAQDGWIIAEAQGVAPFTYNWLDTAGNILKTTVGNFPDTLQNLSTGNYTVEITDDLQCFTTTDFTISEPAALSVNLNVTNISCNGQNNGSITANVSGGSVPYQYSLDGINFQASNIFTGLSDGNYTVTVRDDSTCIATQTATIIEPGLLIIALDSIIDASCFSGNNGAIYTTVSGGTVSYSFEWSNGGNTEDIFNLAGGTYILSVSDANSCNASDTFLVNAGSGFTLSTTTTDVTCNGNADGAAQVTVSGGILPFNFLWSNGDTLQNLNGVVASVYSVIVTDANNCTDSASATVNEPTLLSLSGIATDARCFTGNDGSIQLTASGGITPYEYSNDGIQFQNSGIFNAVPGGNYQAVTRDSNDCIATISLVVNTPLPIATIMNITDVNCFGGIDGTASVSTAGQNTPFTFYWNTGLTDSAINGLNTGNYFVTVTDANGCNAYDTASINSPLALTLNAILSDAQCNGSNDGSISLQVSGGTPAYNYLWNGGQTIATLDSLLAGAYDVVVTDYNSCTVSGSYSITEPSAILLSTDSTDVLCKGANNGVATVSASGGIPPYTYQWDAGANNQTTSSAINLRAGTYSAVISDAHHCTDSASVIVAEPLLILLQLDTAINPLCFGESSGSIAVSASGGSGALDFSWNTNPPYNGTNPTGLPEGNYSVVVTDANGCSDSLTATLTNPPPFIVSILPADTTITYGDSVQLHAVRAPANISPSYIWEPITEIAWCISPCSQPFVSPTTPTTFSVVLIDPNTDCTASAEAFVNVEYENVIYPPNAFTPDGDGINDAFEIFFGPELVRMDYIIFDRWGEKLFQTQTLGDFWKGVYRGKKMNPGVYVYAINATFLDGEQKFYKGSFTLLR